MDRPYFFPDIQMEPLRNQSQIFNEWKTYHDLSLKLQFPALQFKWQLCFYTYSCTWEFVEVATLLNALTTIRQFAGNDGGGDDD